MQQMISQLVVLYTSNNSQGSPQHNDGMDDDLLKSPSITQPTASAAASLQNPVLSKLLMADQDTPLDLSMKRCKAEITQQDGVLDLSIKKTRHHEDLPLRSPKSYYTPPLVPRDAQDSAVDKVDAFQSTSTLEQFMTKLCLNHQLQIVDAFEFLQNEVKTVTSPPKVHLNPQAVTEKPTTSSCSPATLKESPEKSRTPPVAIISSEVQTPDLAVSSKVTPAEQPLELNTDETLTAANQTEIFTDLNDLSISDEVVLSSDEMNTECKTANDQPKCPNIVIVKDRSSGRLEAKKSPKVDNVKQLDTGTLDPGPCDSLPQLQIDSSESVIEPSSSSPVAHGHSEPPSSPKHNNDSCTVKKTTNVILPNTPKTARKSCRASQSRSRDSPGSHVITDPDLNFDIVYVAKPITECELHTQNLLLPKKNARKSTRGHFYVGECWELKTVRTLAHRSVANGSGNCPVHMPEMTTSVTPKQLAKPDGVPALEVPFTGHCMETVMNKNPPDQPVDIEMPGDIVQMASDDLILEPSQTGQTQNKPIISSFSIDEQYESFIESDKGIREKTPTESEVDNNKPTEFATKETTGISTSELIQDESEVTAEPLLNTGSSNITDESSPAKDIGDENMLLTRNTTKCDVQLLEQSEPVEKPYMEKNTQLQITCVSEESSPIGTSQNQVKESDSSLADVEIEQVEEGKVEKPVPVAVERFGTKKTVTKQTVLSDRCLRSRVSKGTLEHITDTLGQKELTDLHDILVSTPKSKPPVKSVPLKQVSPGQESQQNLIVTENPEKADTPPVVMQADTMAVNENVCKNHQKSLTISKSDKGHGGLELQTTHESGVQASTSHTTPDNMEATLDNGIKSLVNTPEKSPKTSKRMSIRDRSNQIEAAQNNTSSISPQENISHDFEQPKVQSKNTIVDDLADGESCIPPNSGSRDSCIPPNSGSENSCILPNSGSRDSAVPPNSDSRDSCTSPNSGSKDSCISPNLGSKDSCGSPNQSSESKALMNLRSRNSSSISQDSAEVINKCSVSVVQPSCEVKSNSNQIKDNTGNQFLTSSLIEQPSSSQSCSSPVLNSSVSPGRMSLRSNTSEKLDSLATPPKSKKPHKLELVKPSSSQERRKLSKNKSSSFISDQLSKKLVDGSSGFSTFNLMNLPVSNPVVPTPSKFLAALNREENQHLISDLNTKFEKMQKGWVQMDKEGPTIPKPKNKADRLKEIWKSKRRTRKHRSSEQQKFSPVQMLFMKSFDLSTICQWFLQTTETQSIVIIKKANTRLPSETQLCFQTSSSLPSSDGNFPNQQAERLKKHLKKFAIASPVKSNAKNKRLIAKVLAQSLAKGKEKREERPAARISSKPQNSSNLNQATSLESHSKVSASTKNPASARILRKYSNMREKKQVHQNSFKKQRSLKGTNKRQVTKKNASKEKPSPQRKNSVKKVKTLSAKTKNASASKGKSPKKTASKALRDSNRKDVTHTKALKSLPSNAAKNNNRKVVLLKTGKSPHAKLKCDSKKSPSSKGSESLVSSSQNMNQKPVPSEDQVLTRSQRKIEATFAQTGSPKTSKKRSSEAIVLPAKRTRTSK